MPPKITIVDIYKYVSVHGDGGTTRNLKEYALHVARLIISRDIKTTKQKAIKAAVLFAIRNQKIKYFQVSLQRELMRKEITFINRCKQFGIDAMIKLLEEENNGGFETVQ